MAENLDADLVARLRKVVKEQGLSVAAMGKELRERDAEISRLRNENSQIVMDRCRAPIEDENGEHSCEPPDCRLRAPPRLRTESVIARPADDPAVAAIASEMLAGAARLVPPGADLIEIGKAARREWRNDMEKHLPDCIARALQQYGDEREARGKGQSAVPPGADVMNIQKLNIPTTPEEAEMRAYVERYSEGEPSDELQYLIHSLKIIDELRAELVDIGECLRYERSAMIRVIEQVKSETRASILAELKSTWTTSGT